MAVLTAHHSIAAAQTIVVEGHVRHRPDDFARLTAPIIATLEATPDWTSAIQVVHQFEGAQSRAVARGEELTVLQDRLRQLVARGTDAWMDADFGRARQIYRRALDIARKAPGDVTSGADWKPLVQRALVGLALSAKRGEDATMAEAAMSEFLRSYPDEVVDRTTFGPEATQLFEVVKAVAAKQAPGSLVVAVDDPGAVVFVNERWAGIGGARLDKLLPGLYRVQVRKGDYAGRIYRVEVSSRRVASLAVEWDFDAALVASEWVGFVFPTSEGKVANLTPYALQLARAVHATTVVVLEESESEGRRLLVGSVLAVETGRPVRTASMTIAPVEPAAERLTMLGRYLAGEVGVTLEPEAAPQRGSRHSPWPWVVGGVGVATAAGGAALLYLDGRCTSGDDNLRTCANVYDTQATGITLTVAGAAIVASAAYLLWHRSTASHAAMPVISASRSAMVLAVQGEL